MLVAERLGALLVTGLIGASFVAVGLVLGVLPGLAAAVGFAFAIPVVMTEGLAGRGALERSARLVRACWPRVLGVCILAGIFTGAATLVAWLVPAGPWQMFVSGFVRLLLYPLPLCALALLYAESSQYMRRSSAPG